MKSFLLLILSLIIGCVASFDVLACAGGWLTFSCTYAKKNKYKMIYLVIPNGTTIQISQNNVWEYQGKFSLCHDTTQKKLSVAVKHLDWDDFGNYKCRFFKNINSSFQEKTAKLNVANDACQAPIQQTAYRGAKINITCNYPQRKYKKKVKFLCKETTSDCRDITSTRSPKSNEAFTTTENNNIFTTSVSHVSSEDAGVYWCGVELRNGNYRATLTQIQLEVKDGSWFTAVIIVTVCVVMIALVVVLVFVKKRLQSSKSRTAEEAQNQEDSRYEEIQELGRKSDAIKTVYATANFPTNTPAFTKDSNVHVTNSSGDVCSTVRNIELYYMVDHQSRGAEDAVYMTVNEPQQH